jgi:hypothetical protein
MKVKIKIYDILGNTSESIVHESELANYNKFGVKYEVIDKIPEPKKPEVLK